MAKKSNETTLTQLTKRFVKLLNGPTERVINLNEASTRLSVAKRRIYDITNVLEGIGLLQKTSKNVTRWIDCPRDSPFAAPPALPDEELLALLNTYQSLEQGVTALEANVRQQLSAEGAYVTYHDIKSFFEGQIVIAVKAPPETMLEVNENLQIWMKSENGEIEVYLCPHNNSNPTQQQQQQPLDATIIEGTGRSTISTTDGQYYDDDYYNNDPTLSSALSETISEDEDPFKPLVPYEAREETHYNYMLDDNYTLTSLFPEDNLGLY